MACRASCHNLFEGPTAADEQPERPHEKPETEAQAAHEKPERPTAPHEKPEPEAQGAISPLPREQSHPLRYIGARVQQLSSEYGTYKTVTARFRPWPTGEIQQKLC